ncbi:MAG: hypothetical protein OXI63_25070, partial [Candidatus Poribacteria bacterium]|nr:hypothetical protein [Candidatus Poribacteria bacterium]
MVRVTISPLCPTVVQISPGSRPGQTYEPQRTSYASRHFLPTSEIHAGAVAPKLTGNNLYFHIVVVSIVVPAWLAAFCARA